MIGYSVINVVLMVSLELVSAQEPCNKVIPVSHNGVSSSISYEEFKQALGEVNAALSDALDTRCQICEQRGDLDDVPRDCRDVLNFGYRTTGVYMIYPLRATPFKVRCDQTTDGGGWTVIQRRVSDSDFYRTWQEYKDGFGDLDTNFWHGNDRTHTLTTSGNHCLRVDLTTNEGESLYAEYSSFFVDSETSKYRLSVSGYSGTAGDAMDYHNGMMFTTKDQDNDNWGNNCAEIYDGAWWYSRCYNSNLNGLYNVSKGSSTSIRWLRSKSPLIYIHCTKTELKFKPC